MRGPPSTANCWWSLTRFLSVKHKSRIREAQWLLSSIKLCHNESFDTLGQACKQAIRVWAEVRKTSAYKETSKELFSYHTISPPPTNVNRYRHPCMSLHRFVMAKRNCNIKLGEEKNSAYGRQRISQPMQILGPIQFWRGCVIYLKEKKKFNP